MSLQRLVDVKGQFSEPHNNSLPVNVSRNVILLINFSKGHLIIFFCPADRRKHYSKSFIVFSASKQINMGMNPHVVKPA